MSRQFKKLEKDTQWVVIFFCAIFNILLWTHVVNEAMAAPINATQGTIDNVPIGQTTPRDGNFTFISSTHASLSGMLSVTAIRIGSLTTQTGTQSAAGDILGFIGTGQPSFVKSGATGLVLTAQGAGSMPIWKAATGGGADLTAPGPIGSVTPDTIKGTTIESTTGLTIDAGGIMSTDTVAAGGSGIVGYADSGAAISSGDRLGYYLLGGAKDAAHTLNNSAGVSSYATQAWTGSAAGANLKLEVTPNGSTTRAVAVTVNQDSVVTLAQPLPVASGGTGSTSASTGTGGVVLATSPTLTTPNLGTPSAIVLSNATSLPLTAIADGMITNAKLATPPAFKIVSFTRLLSIASGTQDVSGVGFAPKAVLFLYGDNAGANASMAGVGMDSLEGATSFNALASYPTNQFYINGSAGSSISSFETAANTGSAYISATLSDGFTLTWTKGGTPTGTLRITALCFR